MTALPHQPTRNGGEFRIAAMALPDMCAALSAAALSALVLFAFHDASWWPPDDSAYGYIARILAGGGVYARDIHDVHAGYVHFLHAEAFRLFGDDLVSMRYTLALAIFAASMLAFALLLPRGRLAALAGAFATSALTAPMFITPSANWYALALAMGTVAALAYLPRGSAARLAAAGFLVGLALLTRQLSGVFIAMGAVTILLMEHQAPSGQRIVLARAILAAMAAVLSLYMANKQSLTGFLLFGAAPLAGLGIAIVRCRCADAAAFRIAMWLTAGAVGAIAPMLVYNLVHGTLAAWAHDTIFAALHLNGMDFIREKNIGLFVLQAIAANFAPLTAFSFAAALFWFLALALPAAFGAACVIGLARNRWEGAFAPLPTMALFYLPVAIHYEIHVYLFHMIALPLCGLLWLAGGRNMDARSAPLAIAVCLMSVMGLTVLGGQPLTRSGMDFVRGERVALDNDRPLPHARIRIERKEADAYREILALIHKHSRPDQPILAAPFVPEFYYLSQRRGWLSGIGTSFELADNGRLEAAIRRLADAPPALVVHKRHDKYNDRRTLALMKAVSAHFRRIATIEDYDIYVPPEKVTERKPLRAMLRGSL